MELRPLSEVDLREATLPINRAVTGHYLPAVRTASGLRERAAMGVLDLKLSRCAFLGRELVGTCLIERVDDRAQVDAIGVEPMAQQRGVGHALLESACVAAEATGVKVIGAEVPEGDAALLATMHSAGFGVRRAVSRWTVSGPATNMTLPVELPPTGAEGHGTGPGLYARPVELSEALSFLATVPRAADPPFVHQPLVLQRMAPRLTAYLLLRVEAEAPLRAAAVLDRERHQLMALGGEPESLASLVALLTLRHGAQVMESLPDEEEGVVQALRLTGMVRSSVRNELWRRFGEP